MGRKPFPGVGAAIARRTSSRPRTRSTRAHSAIDRVRPSVDTARACESRASASEARGWGEFEFREGAGVRDWGAGVRG